MDGRGARAARRGAVPRLERAHHRRVLPAEHGGRADRRRRSAVRGQHLRAPVVQRRTHPPLVAGGAPPRRLRAASSPPTPPPAEPSRRPTGTPSSRSATARPAHAGAVGDRGLRPPLRSPPRRRCGSRRRRSATPCCWCWPRRGSGSRSSAPGQIEAVRPLGADDGAWEAHGPAAYEEPARSSPTPTTRYRSTRAGPYRWRHPEQPGAHRRPRRLRRRAGPRARLRQSHQRRHPRRGRRPRRVGGGGHGRRDVRPPPPGGRA